MRAAIPNSLTLGNLACGLMALLALSHENDPIMASYWVGGALLLDLLDGAVARLLKVDGPLGKQLDSLADVVSFGVVPGLTAFWLADFWWKQHEAEIPGYTYLSLLIPLAACLRLARFNIDNRQGSYFLGLPTPSAAAVIMSLPLVMEFQEKDFLSWWVGHPVLIAFLSIFLSLMMLLPIPLVAAKKQDNGGFHWIVYVLLIIALPAFWFLRAMAVPFIVCLYLLMSIIFFRPNEVQSRD